jgi:hypothetical protein
VITKSSLQIGYPPFVLSQIGNGGFRAGDAVMPKSNSTPKPLSFLSWDLKLRLFWRGNFETSFEIPSYLEIANGPDRDCVNPSLEKRIVFDSGLDFLKNLRHCKAVNPRLKGEMFHLSVERSP